MSDNLSSSAVHPDELCLLCDLAFSQGLPVSVVLQDGRAVPVGGELQEAFYRLLWRDYGLSPGLVERLAVDGVLSSTLLHHSCGMLRLSDPEFVWSCLSLLLLLWCGFYLRSVQMYWCAVSVLYLSSLRWVFVLSFCCLCRSLFRFLSSIRSARALTLTFRWPLTVIHPVAGDPSSAHKVICVCLTLASSNVTRFVHIGDCSGASNPISAY